MTLLRLITVFQRRFTPMKILPWPRGFFLGKAETKRNTRITLEESYANWKNALL